MAEAVISVRFEGEQIYMILSGSIDADAAKMIDKHLNILYHRRAKNIVVDFSRTDYLSSHAVALLSEMRLRLRDENRELRIVGVNHERTRMVFELLGMKRFFALPDQLVPN